MAAGCCDILKAMHHLHRLTLVCTAFPDHEKDNFFAWTDRWKQFMDVAGDDIDFWTIHLYDFPAKGGKKQYRKGGNMESYNFV